MTRKGFALILKNIVDYTKTYSEFEQLENFEAAGFNSSLFSLPVELRGCQQSERIKGSRGFCS